ncbi:ensconsin isoform X7 [Brachyistius frenatus]|uniref:ensconsin isoform X7 n=1 Tax=Brachyistius frenatus TaxID=100188 RepID=UPI0037E70795
MPDSKGRGKGGGGGGCSQGKWRLRKGGSRSAIPALFTITEEEEGQRRRDACKRKKRASYSQYKSEDGRASSATRPSSSGSGQTYTPSLTSTPTPTPSRTTTSNSPSNNAAPKADSLLFNKIDERQRLARERREDREKQNAVKEAQWQAREERARQYYEKHLEERKRRLEDQRMKEEKRRTAVEEKRRQKLDEDKARHEAVIRRTLDRSHKTRQKPNRWSWGGVHHTNIPSTPADADRRSLSTMNLSKQSDPVITKRLSSSSATLLHSPDRGLRCLPLTPWESNVVNRLQQPTHSYLARSRSAMSLSGEQAAMPVCPRSVSCHPMGSMSFKALQAQPLPHCRSQERSLSRETASSSSTIPRRRTTGTTRKDRDNVRKSWSNLTLPLAPVLSLPPSKRSSSPGKKISKVTAPSPGRPPQKTAGRPPTPKRLKSPGAEDPGNLRPVRVTPDSSHPSTPSRAQDKEEERVLSPPLPRPQPLGQNRSSTEQNPATPTGAGEKVSSPPAHKPSAGTTDPEEASRILSEKRRLAREQREREEEERRQQEEQGRLAKEEMARRKAEERARREEEVQHQAEDRRRKEEEERKVEEEKEREEAERLQKQKEEDESRQREEAERLRQEREKHFQKEEAERLERKKRLEEIMKRTRRSDTTEKKVRNGEDAVTPSSPAASAATHNSNGNGRQPDASPTAPSHPDQRENGEFEEVIVLPPHSRLSPAEGEEEEEEQQQEEEEEEEEEQEEGGRVPIVAFMENGLLKPLSGIEDISAQQGPDVA